jgi:hypothetical protein
MLFLGQDTAEIQLARTEHWNYYKCRIKKRIGQPNCATNCIVCNATNARQVAKRSPSFNNIANYLNQGDNLENIVTGQASILLTKNNDFFDHIGITQQNLDDYFGAKKEDRPNLYPNLHRIVLDINSIFSYSDFSSAETSSYGAYTLARNLNRRTCTYCNRTYTNTLSTNAGKKIMRPQFDHWYPQTRFPVLAISFYNLIPSCYICNSSIKNDTILDLTMHVHPYLDANQSDEFQFNYIYRAHLDQYRIFITPLESANTKAFDTMKKLSIDEMYNTHHEELKDLIKIKQAYSDEYIKRMQKFFPKSGLSPNEIYRLIFGVEIESELLHKRPLSKFKRDILRRLDII